MKYYNKMTKNKISFFLLITCLLPLHYSFVSADLKCPRNDDCCLVNELDVEMTVDRDWKILNMDDIFMAWDHLNMYCDIINNQTTITEWVKFLESTYFSNHLVDVWFRKLDAVKWLYYTEPDELGKERRDYIESHKAKHYEHPQIINETMKEIWYGDDWKLIEISINDVNNIKWDISKLWWRYYQLCDDIYNDRDGILLRFQTYQTATPYKADKNKCIALAKKRIESEVAFTSNIISRNITNSIIDVTRQYIYEWVLQWHATDLSDKFARMLWYFEVILKRYNKRTKQCSL